MRACTAGWSERSRSRSCARSVPPYSRIRCTQDATSWISMSASSMPSARSVNACAAGLGMPRARCALPTSTRQVQAQVNLVRPVGANVSWYHRCARLEQIDSYMKHILMLSQCYVDLPQTTAFTRITTQAPRPQPQTQVPPRPQPMVPLPLPLVPQTQPQVPQTQPLVPPRP